MGISTYQSYCGAQIFDAVGLQSSFVEKYFTGTHTASRASACERLPRRRERHADAFGEHPIYKNALDVGGEYAFRIRGEKHSWTPRRWPSCSTPCAATARQVPRIRRGINEQDEELMTCAAVPSQACRDRAQARAAGEVEPAEKS